MLGLVAVALVPTGVVILFAARDLGPALVLAVLAPIVLVFGLVTLLLD